MIDYLPPMNIDGSFLATVDASVNQVVVACKESLSEEKSRLSHTTIDTKMTNLVHVNVGSSC